MRGLHVIAMSVIAFAVILLALAFINIAGKTEREIESAPQTGFALAKEGLTSKGIETNTMDLQKTSDCIADPRKCQGQPTTMPPVATPDLGQPNATNSTA